MKYGVGVTSIKMGEQVKSGGMSTTLESVGKPYKETASIIDEDGAVTKHFHEGARYPFLTIYEAAGTQIKFTLVNIEPLELKKFLGGEATAAVSWNSPVSSFSAERSLSLETKFGIAIEVPNALVYAKLNWNLATKEIAKIEITAEVQQPKVSSEAPMTVRVAEEAQAPQSAAVQIPDSEPTQQSAPVKQPVGK